VVDLRNRKNKTKESVFLFLKKIHELERSPSLEMQEDQKTKQQDQKTKQQDQKTKQQDQKTHERANDSNELKSVTLVELHSL
jgi:hypothetical protein